MTFLSGLAVGFAVGVLAVFGIALFLAIKGFWK